ncbi:autotransporter outer membrane beta-barrel domain-containing protein [Martelella sp. AMO21009]
MNRSDTRKAAERPADRKRMKWIASSILFQSTAIAGTLAGVPLPLYSRGYTRAYAAVSCNPSSVTTETASNIDVDQFQQRNTDVAGQTISCTIGSGTLTGPQYAYGGPYMALYNVGDGGSDTYRGQTYNVHSNWAWSGFGVSVTNNADITVTEAGGTQLLFAPGGSITLSDLRVSDTQYNALGAVSLGALNWSGSDDNMKTGAGNGGAVTIISSGDVSSTVGGGIFALSQGGTNKHADDIGKQYAGSGFAVTVKSYGTVSGSRFGIAALSIGGPSTYSSDSDFSGSGDGDSVYVYAGASVSATASGPAILAASYGGNTPYNVNSFGDGVQGGNGGNSFDLSATNWQNRQAYTAAKVQVGTSSKPMAGTISTQSAGAVNLWLNNHTVQLTRETGAAIAAIARGGNGLAEGGKQAMFGGSAVQSNVYVYGASTTTIKTSGSQSPGIFALSQGGTSYETDKDDNERPGGYGSAVHVTVSGGGTISTGGSNASGIIAQSLGGGGTSTFKQTKGMGAPAGAVTVSSDFSIVTSGDHSHGIIAQSASAADGDGIYTNAGTGALTWGDTSASGSTSSDVTVTNSGNITVYGIDSHGIVAQSIGGGGGLLQSTGTISTTSYATGSAVSDPGGGQTIGGQTAGSAPGQVTVTNKGNISTYGGYAGAKTSASSSDQTALGGGIAILAQSIGGGGGVNTGTGATGAIGAGTGSSSGSGSNGGAVTVHNYGNLTTVGSEAHGIVAQSIGGGGGQGRNKKGLFHTVGGAGGPGGAGGTVDLVTESSTSITLGGDYAMGMVAQSIGGGGGAGGQATAWGLFFSSATGGSGGAGGAGGQAKVTQFGSGTKGASDYSALSTKGDHGTGILVQSIGGGGGIGGNGKSTSAGFGIDISIAHGGSGAYGGSGGDAKVYTNGVVATSGTDAQGIVVQSIGGGGGSGGQASSKAIAAGVPFDEDGNTISFSVSIAHGGIGGAGGDGGTAEAHVYKTSRIQTSGDGAAGLVVQSIGGGGGNGGDATASSVAKSITSWLAEDEEKVDAGTDFAVSVNSYVGGYGGVGGVGGTVSVSHYGAISTTGGYADGILAHSIGGGGGNAGTGSGSTKAADGIKTAALNIGLGAYGGAGTDGGSVDVHMDDAGASIYTGGHVSRGIFAQSIGGGGGSSSGGGGSGDADWDITIGLGAQGSAGGDGGAVSISSEGAITTKGDWSDAILAQSIGGGGGAAGSGKSSLSIKEDEDDDNDDDDGGDDAEATETSLAMVSSSDEDDDDDDDDSDDKTLTFGVTVGSTGGAGGAGGAITIGKDSSGTVVGTGTIHTYGTMSAGIVAQSIGGGGGAVAISSGSDDSDDSDTSSSCDTSGGSSSSSSDDSSSDDKDSCATLTIGSQGGSGGDGGAVSVYAGSIYTGGFASHGIVAQSIAGGGGIGFSSGLAVSKVKIGLGGKADGNAGTAGTVTVKTLSDTKIVTKGDAAQGIIAQSIGGGGGLFGAALGTDSAVNDDSISKILSVTMGSGSNPGTAHGGKAAITHSGAITTYGTRSVGIVGQSISGGGGFMTAAETVLDEISFVQKQAPNSADAVTVDLEEGASIVTSGDGAFGILAQTITGGGGVAADLAQKLNASYGYYDSLSSGSNFYYTDNGNADSAGTVGVTIASGASVKTSGKYAHGIVAQAIGGSGGIFTKNGKTYAGTLGRFNNTKNGEADGNAQSGSLAVTIGGSVAVTDPTAWGVWAQTTGETMTLTLDKGGSLTGSTASAVNGAYQGGAVYASAAKRTSITHNNYGTLTGNVVHHAFDTSSSSAANGAVQMAALGGTSLLLNQGTGTFVTGAIADVDSVLNAGSIDPGGAWNTIATTFTGDLAGVGSAGSAYDVADLGLSTAFSPFSYFKRSDRIDWRTESASKGGLFTNLDVDMEHGTADRLTIAGDFAGTWGVDINANALLPHTRSEFLTVEGSDSSTLTALSSLVFDFTDVTKSAEGWYGFSVDNAYFTGNGVSLGKNAGEVSKAMQQAWDKIADDSATEVKFAEDEISLGQAFGAFHQSEPDTFSDMLLELASQTAAAPLADSPSAAIAAANSVLSCPAFETTGVMMDEGSCVWSRVLGGETTQDAHGDASGYTQSVGGLQIGGQTELSDGWFLGSGLTYENSWFRNDSGSEKMDQQSFTGAVALKREMGPWLFGLVGGAGYNWGDSKRYINLDTLSATARGEPDSAMFFARFRASYEIALGDEYYMRPKVDFDVINMHQFGYTETGAGALNLMVDGNSDTAFGVTPGIEFGARIPFKENWPARLYGDLGVTFLTSDEWETTARFAGLSSMDSFSTFTPIADTVGHVSIGLDLAQRQGMELKFQYDGSFADDYQSHVGSVRFGYRF